MSTAGAAGFQVGGEYKVAYNHNDSYPSGLGARIAALIARTAPEKLRAAAESVTMVNDKSPEPTDEQIEHCAGWTNVWVASNSKKDWYCLTRDAQDSLQAYVRGLQYMYGNLDNTYGYAFIWNSDANLLEYYRNFSAAKRRDVAPTKTAAGTLLYAHGELMACIPYEALRAVVARGFVQDYFEELDGLVLAEDVLVKPELGEHNERIAARLREIVEVAQNKTAVLATAGESAIEDGEPSQKELLASLLSSFDGDEIVLDAAQRQQLRTLTAPSATRQ